MEHENKNIASIRVEIDETLYQKFRAALALKGITVKDVISDFVSDYVKLNPVEAKK